MYLLKIERRAPFGFQKKIARRAAVLPAALAGCLVISGLALVPALGGQPAAEKATRLLLLQYGSGTFPAGFALQGKAENQRVPFAWMFYLLQHGKRVILIDTGFSNEERRRTFQVKDFRPPLDLLASVGIRPEQVSEVLLTHGHFDHAGEIARFPRARIYFRRAGRDILMSRHGPAGVRSVLDRARLRGLLVELPARNGGAEAVLRGDGLRVDLRFTGGHSPGSQAVLIRHGERRFIITGDECYLLSECRSGRGLPARAAFSPASNRRFMTYLKREVDRGAVLLNMHDPELPGRFTRLKPGVFQVF